MLTLKDGLGVEECCCSETRLEIHLTFKVSRDLRNASRLAACFRFGTNTSMLHFTLRTIELWQGHE
jgi:hypothetical protein